MQLMQEMVTSDMEVTFGVETLHGQAARLRAGHATALGCIAVSVVQLRLIWQAAGIEKVSMRDDYGAQGQNTGLNIAIIMNGLN